LTKVPKRWFVAGLLAAALIALYALYGVKVRADLSRKTNIACPQTHPIEVTVHNFTFRRLAKVTLKLEGWRNDRSTDILSNNSYVFDAVIKPFSSRYECFSDKAFYVPSTSPSLAEGVPENAQVRINIGDVFKEMNEFNDKTDGVKIVVREIHTEFY